MTSKEIVLSDMRARGKADALDLRARSQEMDGTAVIAEESKVPVFDREKDYSDWPTGSPVRTLVEGEYQVYKLLQPYNAAHYSDAPPNLPALWSLCHTTDPEKAKPYMPPLGTSGLYMAGECCTKDGIVWRSLVDNNAWTPGDIGTEIMWEVVA